MTTTKRKLTTSQKLSRVSFYSFLLLLTAVAVLNAQPYLKVAKDLFSEVEVIPGIEVINAIPLAGPIVSLIGLMLPTVLGVITWSVLQLLQCIPLFMSDPEILLKRIESARQWSEVNLGTSRSDWLNDLIKRFSNFPSDLQERLINSASIAYLIDLVIACWHYPPLKTSITSVGQATEYLGQLLTGEFQFALVDWGACFKICVMLFAFEGIIAIAVFIRQIAFCLFTPKLEAE